MTRQAAPPAQAMAMMAAGAAAMPMPTLYRSMPGGRMQTTASRPMPPARPWWADDDMSDGVFGNGFNLAYNILVYRICLYCMTCSKSEIVSLVCILMNLVSRDCTNAYSKH